MTSLNATRATLTLFLCVALAGGQAVGQWETRESARHPRCQILDDVPGPLYDVALGYVPESHFDGYGDSAIIEMDINWDLGLYRGVLGGDLDVRLHMESDLFMDSAGLQLPDQLGIFALDAAWTIRPYDYTGFRVRLKPGIYSDLEALSAGSLYVPFSAVVVQSFSSSLSGMLGMEIRPGFERALIPIASVAYACSPLLRLEAGFPQSRCFYHLHPDWTLELGFDWRSVSYGLREKGSFDRDQVTIEDYRLYAGVTQRLRDDVQLSYQLGRVYGRSLEFQEDAAPLDSDIDVERATYVRVVLGGPF